jgi:hypothetical protein
MANPAGAPLREFHPLELILARLRGWHRTMAVNPTIWFGSNRVHTETTVLAQLKKASRIALQPSVVVKSPPIFFDGPAEFTESAHRVCGSTPIRSDQPEFLEWTCPRPFPKPLVEEWSPLHKRTTILSLCVSVRFEKACCWCFEKIANFFLSFSLLSE